MRQHNSLVRTKELEYSYNTGKYSVEEAIGLLAIELANDVALEVVSTLRRDPAGWPYVRLCGPRAMVADTLWRVWSAGMGPDEKDDFVASMIEDDYTSGVGLCTFCREAFDKELPHVCELVVSCPICRSRTINYLGEMYHVSQACFDAEL
jgi:hypothetical protein